MSRSSLVSRFGAGEAERGETFHVFFFISDVQILDDATDKYVSSTLVLSSVLVGTTYLSRE